MNVPSDFNTVITVGSIIVNLMMVFITMRVKSDIAEVKIWILENFERRANEKG